MSDRTLPPLLVLPLPADARLVADILLAACNWHEQVHSRALTMTQVLEEQHPVFGRALVIRADPAVDGER